MKDRRFRAGKLVLSWLLVCSLLLTGCSANGLFQQMQESVSQMSDTYAKASKDEQITTAETLSTESAGSSVGRQKLKVHFIDVGQGSATLFESNGKFMLMDGGESDASSKVVSYLKKQGVKSLEYIVVSHYDSDHLNGVVGALNVFRVKKVIGPDYETDSRVYTSFVQALNTKGIKRISPKVGKKYKLGKAKFTIIAPNSKNYSDENDASVSIRLVNGKNRFVVTGDATYNSEYEMLENGQNLSCDVYVAGHHGSSMSSSEKFLQAMKPQYTVISCGEDNSYGHPSQSTMSRLKAIGTKVFRTDEQGTIVATSNGKKITWNHKPSTSWAYREYGESTSEEGKVTQETDVAATQDNSGKYIGNVNSKKFHSPNCSSLPAEHNRIYFDSVQEAENAGYSPCGWCHPVG